MENETSNDINKKNRTKIFTPLGASNHSANERETNDYYATDPRALEMLLELESFSQDIWECACGGGHLSRVLLAHGYNVRSSDLIDRGFEGTEVLDFLQTTAEDIAEDKQRDIITNPPYKHCHAFVEHALDISKDGTKIAMFLKLQFLEGKARRILFDKCPPKKVYVSSGRFACAKSGDFSQKESSAIAYAWFIWEKGYSGDTVVKWFN